MKRLLLILILPIMACNGLTAPTTTTNPPPTPPIADSATEAVATAPGEVQPATEVPATFPPVVNAGQFPNPAEYEWRQIISGLQRPVDLQSAHDDTGRLFIIEKHGTIRVYENGQLLDEPFLNITDRIDESGNEMGLLGLAFDPHYRENGYFYVNYTGARGHTRISRFHAEGNFADPNSETVLLLIEQPYENHNGGSLAFGPDGYLYAGLGDGGSGGDPEKNGQNTKVLLGKILRIDVTHGDPYSIPADNPFGNEVWAYGLRNPWRISFDRATGDLWIGDVGQGEWEEIDYLPAGSASGANFGWSIMEGAHAFDGDAQPGLLLPVAEYSHSSPYEGCSVTGGYVYRGSMPEWNGIYLYGDYCTGYVWGLLNVNGQFENQRLFEPGVTITSFGEDQNGEIYLVSDTGEVYTLVKK
ncbi:MAG: PQQ-dependent sugar dehydrogenase [Anaerolineales bacterium]|nr:PQQ-dependent sugar dehydrogenase [Anaerolineales bacterium]